MFLNFARNMGADVHIVTELITSLLGLIVFPYEEIRRTREHVFDRYNQIGKGWRFSKGSPANLEDLIRHLRNAISHRRLFFSSDSRELESVEITFMDRRNPSGPDDWEATINAADLQRFVLAFADMIEEWESDYS
jgi:HEPN pEK499 p136